MNNPLIKIERMIKFCFEKYPWPFHHEFKSIRNNLSEMLQKTTVGQFNDDLIKGKILLTKSHINPDKTIGNSLD